MEKISLDKHQMTGNFPIPKEKQQLSIIMSATDYREMSSTRMPPSKINKVLSGLAE